jgi:outer membrane protein assembly factor BamB
MTTSVARPALFTIAPPPGASGGTGRNTPAKSGVGEAGQGAVTLANVRPNPPRPAGPPPPNPAQPGRVNTANPPGGQLGAGPFLVFALASDGMLHSLHLSNGADYKAPAKFIPPNATASGLLVSDQFAYVATQNGCNGTANGVWAMDLESKEVKTFKANVVGANGMAFDADGTIFVATGSGGEKANSVVALDHKTLAVKASFAAGTEFSSSPLIFSHKEKSMVAASTKDGRIHLLDATDLSKPIASSAATVKAADFMPGALTSWQDQTGTRWILAPVTNSQATELGFSANGAKGAVVAWKVVNENGTISLQPAWASRDLISPLTPTIINGVAFVTSSGEFKSKDSKMTAAQRAARSAPAVLYALDAMTGKELWNSGTTITSFAHGGTLSGGVSQIYVTTYDGTIYTFGFPMEH